MFVTIFKLQAGDARVDESSEETQSRKKAMCKKITYRSVYDLCTFQIFDAKPLQKVPVFKISAVAFKETIIDDTKHNGFARYKLYKREDAINLSKQ